MSRESKPERPVRALLSVYGAGLCAGLSVVSFPASANQLKAAHGISDAAYGSIFLPQVALTVLGSVLGGTLAKTRGLAVVLRCALSALVASMLALAATAQLASNAYPLLLLATSLVGLGFGLAAAPLNAYPAELFPRRAETALVALHTVIGAGFALGPVLVAASARHGLWQATVLGVGLVGLALLLLVPSPGAAGVEAERGEVVAREGEAQGLSLFVLLAVLYAFAEGTFANWATVYLHEERAVSEADAAVALSAFWAALVIGRLLVSALLLRVSAQGVWLALPPMMALSFVALPNAHDALSGGALFALAGLSCGAFFPLTVSQAVARTQKSAALVSSALTAALMIGSGLGSFLIGPLRTLTTLENIYLLSSVYPILAGVLAARASRARVRSAPPALANM